MIIDAHAHIYPEKIAEKATAAIGDFYDASMRYHGHMQELIESGKKIGVDKFLVHSTATKAAQVESINNFIISSVNAEPLFVGYGTIHPDYENFEAELKRIKGAGLKGVKLHPDFQHFAVDADCMDPIYEVLVAEKMPVLVHAGDCRYDYSQPHRIAHLLEKHPSLDVIAAHFGGYTQWAESEECLCGKRVWFDTSSTTWKLPAEDANRMLKKHGYEKFFFGSDFPMWDHEGEVERLKKYDISSSQMEMIMGENARQFLGL